MCLTRPVAEHGTLLEQLGQRLAVADHEGVLEQRFELLRRPRSWSHGGANVVRSGAPAYSRKLVFRKQGSGRTIAP